MKWSENDLKFLKENYSKLNNKVLTEKLNRTPTSIESKASKLKLIKDKIVKAEALSKFNKEKGRDLTKEKLMEIALNYKTRGDFQYKDSSAYRTAYKLGILDEICKHMIVIKYSSPQLILKYILNKLIDKEILYNDRKVIKPYELDIYIPYFKLAFEYNGKHWHINDIIDKNILCENLGITLININENSRNYEQDIKQQLISNLNIINNITNLNINKNDIENIIVNNSIYDGILNIEEIKTICNSYNNYTIFKKEHYNVYQKLKRLNKLNEFTNHMKKRNV
jgi:hypothetical protein